MFTSLLLGSGMYRESESESEIVVTVLTLLAANIKDREEIKRSEVSRDSFIELIYEEHVVVGSLLFYTLQVTTND